MKSQYKDTDDIAGAGRRHQDGATSIGALFAARPHRSWRLRLTVVATLALAPAASQAQQRIALANADAHRRW